MEVKCTVKEANRITSDSIRELKVESTSDWPHKTVKLIIDDKKIVVDPDELIKSVKNCTNC